MRSLTIDGRTITDGGPAYVVAEIGHNHMGDLEECKRLFAAAKACGADAVKLQKRDNKALYTREFYDAPYENENSYGATYGEHREALEFGRQEYMALQKYAREVGITFFSTAFDEKSVDFVLCRGMPAIKIASGDLTNTPLLAYMAGYYVPLFLSTGGGTLDDVKRAHETITYYHDNFAILQCTSGYPCQPSEMNLRVIEAYRREFPNHIIGLSDHQNGIAMALVGYMLGACIIEKHFTLNRANKGTDHKFSLEPTGLRKLVRDLRRAREAMGDGVKRPYESESGPLWKMRKSLVAARLIPMGGLIRREDVACKSPGGGLLPYRIEEVVGKYTMQPIHQGWRFELQGLSKEEA